MSPARPTRRRLFPRLRPGHHPVSPHCRHALIVFGRPYFVGAIRSRNCPAILQFQERHETWIDLLYGSRKPLQSVGRRLIIRCRRLWSRDKWQSKSQTPLADDPDAEFSPAGPFSKKLKARYVRQLWLRRKALDVLLCERAHQRFMSIDRLPEKGC